MLPLLSPCSELVWMAQGRQRRDGVQGMRGAMDLLYNTTGKAECYDTSTTTGPAAPGDVWLYLWCTVVRPRLEQAFAFQSDSMMPPGLRSCGCHACCNEELTLCKWAQGLAQEQPYFHARGPPYDMFWDQGACLACDCACSASFPGCSCS